MQPAYQAGLSERWILIADVTNTTNFFWELTQIGRRHPKAFFEASGCYATEMDRMFGEMSHLSNDQLVVSLSNTMGDGFLLAGSHGHGNEHIQKEAAKILRLAEYVKRRCDEILSCTNPNSKQTDQHGTSFGTV